ncbi:MAG: DoxX family protein [Patescibacteria group bacterium]|nr:DoxX family protein [Patescibacteria group bacterium]
MIQPLFVFSDWALLILRLVLGVIMLVHGLPKIKDLKANGQNFVAIGFKPGMFWGTIAALVEFVGGIALIAGFFTQIVAIFIFIQFLVVIFKVDLEKGFVDGYEYPLLIAAAALILATMGGGIYNLDSYLDISIY